LLNNAFYGGNREMYLLVSVDLQLCWPMGTTMELKNILIRFTHLKKHQFQS